MANAIHNLDALLIEIKLARWFLYKEESAIKIDTQFLLKFAEIDFFLFTFHFSQETHKTFLIPLFKGDLAFSKPEFLTFLELQLSSLLEAEDQIYKVNFDSSNLIYLSKNGLFIKIFAELGERLKRELSQQELLASSHLCPPLLQIIEFDFLDSKFSQVGMVSKQINPAQNLWEYLIEHPREIENELKNLSVHLAEIHNLLEVGQANPFLQLQKYALKDKELGLNLEFEQTQRLAHGDFHLGQVLKSGTHLYTIDWEGSPLHNPFWPQCDHFFLNDLAGLFRSIDYLIITQNLELNTLKIWSSLWDLYFKTLRKTPNAIDKGIMALALKTRNLYEIDYEKNARPHLSYIPEAGYQHTIAFARQLNLVL